MRLANICALGALVWAVAGLAAGLWVQAELFTPGVQGDLAAKKALFDAAIPFHGSLLQVSLPLAGGTALGLALLGERRKWLAVSAASIVVLMISAIFPVMLGAVLVMARRYTLGVDFDSNPAISVATAFAGLAAAGMAVPEARMSTVLAGLAGALPLALAGLLEVILANAGADAAVHETYFLLARDHAYGLVLIFWTFAVLLAWAGKGQPAGRFLPAATVVLVALVAGGGLVLAEVRLGLLGMPRHYIDYAEDFFPLHRLAGWCGFALAFSMAAGAGFLVFLKFRPRLSAPDTFG